MLSPKKAREILLKKFPHSRIDGYVEWGDLYAMDVQPTSGDFACDSIFSVDKNTGKVSEFAPLLLDDPDFFFETAKLIPFD